MNRAYLLRHYHPECTTGVLTALDPRGNLLFACVTLELPWRDNTPQVSCIPEGEYQVAVRSTDKFGQHYHVSEVPGREWILFHPATFTSQLRGCIIPGEWLKDLNADGIHDITNTRKTLDRMLAALGDTFRLHILSAPVSGGTLPAVEIKP